MTPADSYFRGILATNMVSSSSEFDFSWGLMATTDGRGRAENPSLGICFWADPLALVDFYFGSRSASVDALQIEYRITRLSVSNEADRVFCFCFRLRVKSNSIYHPLSIEVIMNTFGQKEFMA